MLCLPPQIYLIWTLDPKLFLWGKQVYFTVRVPSIFETCVSFKQAIIVCLESSATRIRRNRKVDVFSLKAFGVTLKLLHHFTDIPYIFLPAYTGIASDYAATRVIDHHAKEIVAKSIGHSWRELARNLPWKIKSIFVEAKIQNIDAEFLRNQYEAAYKVLNDWHGDQGSGATLGKLCDALIKIDKRYIAEELVK